MMLVDSSVWVDFLRGTPSRQAEYLRAQLGLGRAPFMGDLVLCEVLQGSRSEAQLESRRRYFDLLPLLRICDKDVAIESARFYRQLRARGITVRKTIDCLIATRCIRDDIPLLYGDRDFVPFITYFGLRPAPTSGVN